jgi:ABC-type branched-subunit amino acid transport system permease subunit
MIDAFDFLQDPWVRWPVTLVLIAIFLGASVSLLPGWLGFVALTVAVIAGVGGYVMQRRR